MTSPNFGEFEREWTEFLNELRTALPGVQLLFGFLLSVPFTNRFEALDPIGRISYFASFLTTTAACAFLIAPSVYHRLHWRGDVRDKENMLTVCNGLAITGAAMLALSMTLAVFFVTWFISPHWLAALCTGLGAGLFLWLWFGLPLRRRSREHGQR
jgi:tellurite resistance protein TehA-like permease